MSIVTNTNVDSFFGDAVEAALATRSVNASPASKAYLIGVLAEFARQTAPPATFERPITLLLSEALAAPPAERFEKLKGVGDGSLYVSGFFPEHLEAKGVDDAYIARMGAKAYGAAGSLLCSSENVSTDLFGELAANFAALVRVLREVANGCFAASARGAESLVRVYEKWQKTGSPALAEALVAQGLVPVKACGGMQ